ncbi:MAG: methionyl-tRNA formyltransferase [Anaerolineae bacterium]|nr:MAG: methionyl-tRNA formyltransferase [Anaerolineae bacterium]
MGSPEFAVPSLRALAKSASIVGVFTQPDRQAGRGKKVSPPPVKQAAEELGLPVFQPPRLKGEALDQLRALAPELIVVAAFGQILRSAVLDLPKYGCINVHASLLPRWRGAAPINAAILHGDSVTGISIMKMDEGIDTGPILAQKELPISTGDTAETLALRLAELGAELLTATLPRYLEGTLQPTPQPEDGATYIGMLKKDDGWLDTARPAVQLERQVRAYQPWPGSAILWKGQPLKILRASVQSGNRPAGERLVLDSLPAIGTSEGILLLESLQPAGKRPMDGNSFLQGARDWSSH